MKKPSVMTTLCYIEKENSYLMLHRVVKKNDVNKDKWIGVGGHFEEGESPEECLLREVKEETGLTLKTYDFRGLVTFKLTDSVTGNTLKENFPPAMRGFWNGCPKKRSRIWKYGKGIRSFSVF